MDWLKRKLAAHKNTLLCSGLVTSSLLTLGYTCKYSLLSWQQRQMDALLRGAALEQHFAQHCHNTAASLGGYLVKLQERIEELCGTTLLIGSIRSGEKGKREGWEALKRQVLTKLLLAVHSSTLLCLFVSVQLTVVKCEIVGSMTGEEEEGAVKEVVKGYLGKVADILASSLPLLYRACHQEMEYRASHLHLDSHLLPEDILVLFDNVDITGSLDLLQLCTVTSEGSDALSQITQDVCGSEDFRNLYRTLVELTQRHICSEIEGVSGAALPLVKFLGPLNKIPQSVLVGRQEELISSLMHNRLHKLFACNLYQTLTNT